MLGNTQGNGPPPYCSREPRNGDPSLNVDQRSHQQQLLSKFHARLAALDGSPQDAPKAPHVLQERVFLESREDLGFTRNEIQERTFPNSGPIINYVSVVLFGLKPPMVVTCYRVVGAEQNTIKVA